MEVPILTQPEDWALPWGDAVVVSLGWVPILTQPEDWALPYLNAYDQTDRSGHVPILTQPEDWALQQF